MLKISTKDDLQRLINEEIQESSDARLQGIPVPWEGQQTAGRAVQGRVGVR